MARKKSQNKSKPRGRHKKEDTVDWTPAFLKAIRDGLHVRDACKQVDIDGSLPYQKRIADPGFGKAWELAAKIGMRELEREAHRRAFHGTLKPVYQKGSKVGQIREYSDTLIMFLMRSRNPKKYRDNSKVEHVGKDGKELPAAVASVAIYLPENGRGKPHVADDGSGAETAPAIDRLGSSNGTNGTH